MRTTRRCLPHGCVLLLAGALSSCGGGEDPASRLTASGPQPIGNTEPMRVVAGTTQTEQVCPGPALPPTGCFTIDTSVIGGLAQDQYVVTQPTGVLFNTHRRRAELGAMAPSTAAQYCSANPLADLASGLPTLSFDTGTVSIFETALQGGQTRASADMAFTGMRTSDGYSVPNFGFIWNRVRDSSTIALQFRPSIDSNLAGIVGLTQDLEMTVDLSTGETHSWTSPELPEALQRLLLATAYRLPTLLATASQVEVRPGNTVPLWTVGEATAVAATFSHAAFTVSQPVFAPIPTLTCSQNSCQEGSELNKFRDYLSRYGGDYLLGRAATTRGLITNLRAWAANESLTVYPGFVVGQPNQLDFRPKYELQWFLVPLVKTWSMVRQDALVTASDRALIDAWVSRLVAYAVEPAGGPQNDDNPFNVGYLTKGLQMAWGVVTGNHTHFAQGVERLYMGLHQMRTDGSFPREVARGACAMRYQDTMLLNLVLIAEVAAEQGYDPYGLTVDGKSIHTAVKFLLDAVDNPALVLAYADEDSSNCTNATAQPMDLSGVVQSQAGFTYSAWLEPYMARFPEHANSARLANLLQGGLAGHRPIYHPHSGGNTTCFSAGSGPQLSTLKLQCLFGWAATNYASYVAPPASGWQAGGLYFYQHFAGSQSYLGVSMADRRLYYLSPPGLLNLGLVEEWVSLAGCQP